MRFTTLARSAAALTSTTLATALFLPAALATPAHADTADTTDEADQTGRMMLVLDSSGSMKEKAAGGKTKIQAARQALTAVVDDLPDDQVVGMRVFGATVFSRNDAGACKDTQQVVAPATDNRDDLRSAITAYKPYGETPIGNALLAAAQDLGSEGRRSIVLVSDGEATCAPDPCEVAARISKQGIDLTVDVVGLSVDAKTRRQLRCIADSGGGQYYDAKDAAGISAALGTAATRAARPWAVTGTPIIGGPSAASATAITVGDWRDTLGPQGTTEGQRWYRFTRTIPGSTLRVSAAMTAPSAKGGEDDGLMLETYAGNDTCNDSRDSGQNRWDLLLSVTTNTPGTNSYVDECADGDEITISVTRELPGRDNTHTSTEPLEIRVIEEPPATNAATLPSNAPEVDKTAPALTGAGALPIGGQSFGDAVTLDPGAYQGKLVPGEVQIFKVDLDWGESLASVVEFHPLSAGQESILGDQRLNATLGTFSPGRAAADADRSDRWSTLSKYGDADLGSFTRAVTYNERESHDRAAAAASLAGPYYLVVGVTGDDGGPVTGRAVDLELGFTIGVGVNGETKGAPDYVSEAPQIGSDLSGGTDPGDDEATEDGAADDGAADESGEVTDEVVNAAEQTDDGSILPYVLLGAGVLVLAIGGGVIALVVTQRRKRTAVQDPQRPWDGPPGGGYGGGYPS